MALAFGGVSGCEFAGRENLPRRGRLIVACNHVSIWDPLFLAHALIRNSGRRPYFLGKREVFSNAFFRYVLNRIQIIPLDRQRGDVGALKRGLEVLEGEEMLALYPEGTRSLGRVLRAKPGIGYLAIHSKSPILPVRVWGAESYPREKLRLRFGRLRPPDSHPQERDKGSYQALADAVMQDIRALEW